MQSSTIYQTSLTEHKGTTYYLQRTLDAEYQLVVEGAATDFFGIEQNGQTICKLTPQNAEVLRSKLSWLNPVPLGKVSSFGFGDRLGLATPGHIGSLEAVNSNIAPIFAQQSVRENSRTGRTPRQVLDDAMWGVFKKGWHAPWGADADHVKEITHITPFIEAGYTFYTIDPSDHVDNNAQTDEVETLRQKMSNLPWSQLDTSYESMFLEYCTSSLTLDGISLHFNEETLLRALVKYGQALVHTQTLTQEIKRQLGERPFDLEMSVDESDTPTSPEEHYFIANELLKRKIPIVSLAPRFIGKFQKGVDYIGDVAEFEEQLVKHTAIMRHFSSYKLSIHTGSDKFSIYELINQYTDGYVHVKTAGTSYLEALRVISQSDPEFFRKILDLSHERFDKDRKTYFLDCRPQMVPTSDQLANLALSELIEQFDARQLLHVTFGSILDEYGGQLKAELVAKEKIYESMLIAHFKRHLVCFC